LKQYKIEIIYSNKYITNTMFFKSDDTTYSYKDIQTVLENECCDIVIKPKSTQVKVLPKNEINKNTNNNKTYSIKVKSNLNNLKSQGWHHS
jgi:hypothetical protein